MARFIFKFSLFFMVALGLSGCGEEVSWHQNLLIEVKTPAGVKTGSSIVLVKKSETSGWWVPIEARGVGSSTKGEATVIDLGNGKFLFALLGKAGPMALQTFRKEVYEDAEWPKWAQNITRLSGEKNVPPKQYPMFVTFSDINKPASVKLVDPRNLAATFGVGYALKSITLEITDEPVTTGKVESVLGWLGEYKSKQFRLNGEKCVACPKDDTLAAKLGGSNFLIEGK